MADSYERASGGEILVYMISIAYRWITAASKVQSTPPENRTASLGSLWDCQYVRPPKADSSTHPVTADGMFSTRWRTLAVSAVTKLSTSASIARSGVVLDGTALLMGSGLA